MCVVVGWFVRGKSESSAGRSLSLSSSPSQMLIKQHNRHLLFLIAIKRMKRSRVRLHLFSLKEKCRTVLMSSRTIYASNSFVALKMNA